jgi:UDP-N-acetylmuramate dehydrogenase
MSPANQALIKRNQPLIAFNTLAVEVSAAYFSAVDSVDALRDLLHHTPSDNILILGGGSNLVFTQDYDGLVILNQIMGIEVLQEDQNEVLVKVGAGQNWDQWVAYSIEQGWFGLENLSLIPGSVGAAPIQNIGAYGVELKDCLQRVETVEIATQQVCCFDLAACRMGYRDSAFKREFKGRYAITAVVMKLSKKPQLHLGYGEISQCMQSLGLDASCLSAAQLRDIIVRIRRAKLPDPSRLPNVGSFFKNPVVSSMAYQKTLEQYPDIVAYPMQDGRVKLAAGWLIDRLGWKGRQQGQASVHERQALVLINHGGSSNDLLRLAESIQMDVRTHFGVNLEVEPNII